MRFWTIKKEVIEINKTNLAKQFEELRTSAVLSKDWNKVESFLKLLTKEELNSEFGYQESLLHILVRQAPYNIIKLALKKGANPNKANSYGRTPLFYLQDCRYNNDQNMRVKVFDLLMKSGCDLNHIDESGCNFLMHSFNYNIALKLDYNNFDINHVDNFGRNIVIHLIEYESSDRVKFLEKVLPRIENINSRDKTGVSPLLKATLLLRAPSIKALLKHGADRTLCTDREYSVFQSDKGKIPKGLTAQEIIDFFNRDRTILIPEELMSDELTCEIFYGELENSEKALKEK
nr:hypothetical protein [uncultured Carboxylicivirga sp.]